MDFEEAQSRWLLAEVPSEDEPDSRCAAKHIFARLGILRIPPYRVHGRLITYTPEPSVAERILDDAQLSP